MNSAFNIRKNIKAVEINRGLKDYKMPWDDAISVLENSLLEEINSVKSSVSDIAESEESEVKKLQHFGTTTTMTTSEQIFTYADLGFPSTIEGASPFAIPWADRSIRVYDYDVNSVTLRVGDAGIADLPLTVGLEITGWGSVFPKKIYNAVVEAIRCESDRGVRCSSINGDSLTLVAFAEGIDNPPFVVGLRISGREEWDEGLKYWETNVTMTSEEQEFEFEDIEAGIIDDYAYIVSATLAIDEDTKTFYYGDLIDARGGKLVANIKDARIAGLVPTENMSGYITACENTYFTLAKSMAGITMDEAITFWVAIRGVEA